MPSRNKTGSISSFRGTFISDCEHSVVLKIDEEEPFPYCWTETEPPMKPHEVDWLRIPPQENESIVV